MRGGPEGAGGAVYELPQSKIDFNKPIFASPLLKAGAKGAPAPVQITKVNDNLAVFFLEFLHEGH